MLFEGQLFQSRIIESSDSLIHRCHDTGPPVHQRKFVQACKRSGPGGPEGLEGGQRIGKKNGKKNGKKSVINVTATLQRLQRLRFMLDVFTSGKLHILGVSEVLPPDAFSCNLAMKACEMGLPLGQSTKCNLSHLSTARSCQIRRIRKDI